MTNHHTSSNSIPPHLTQTFAPFKASRFIVGLTGGIGSGKTVVSDWFAAQNIVVVDADVVAHQIMQKDSPTLQHVIEAFGDWAVDDAGQMNRKAVREYVFANDKALLKLEEITHPAIRQQIKAQLLSATSDYVILSAPLLLESSEAGLRSLCDRVLVVDVTKENQLLRAGQRDKQSVEQIAAIMDNQMPREDRLKHADDVVNNDGDLDALYDQLENLHSKYLQLSQKN